MSLYVRVYTSFYTHRKTMRLKAALGDDAFWIPPRLWAYAAINQPDGDFSSYTAAELACSIGYPKNASSMLQALLQAGFLDPDMRIHDWLEHNGCHQVFAERAKKAALARWEKERTKERQKTVQEGRREEPSIASSMLQACEHAKNGKPPLVFPSEYRNLIKDAESEIEAIKGRGILKDSDREEIKALRLKIGTWKKKRFESA